MGPLSPVLLASRIWMESSPDEDPNNLKPGEPTT